MLVCCAEMHQLFYFCALLFAGLVHGTWCLVVRLGRATFAHGVDNLAESPSCEAGGSGPTAAVIRDKIKLIYNQL